VEKKNGPSEKVSDRCSECSLDLESVMHFIRQRFSCHEITVMKTEASASTSLMMMITSL